MGTVVPAVIIVLPVFCSVCALHLKNLQKCRPMGGVDREGSITLPVFL